MVKRFLEQEPAIRRVLTADYSHTNLLIGPDQLCQLKAVDSVLERLEPLTDMLSGRFAALLRCDRASAVTRGKFYVCESSLHLDRWRIEHTGLFSGEYMVTISLVLPMLSLIADICAPEEEEENEVLSAMMTRMRAVIIDYLTDKLKERTKLQPIPGLPFYEKCSFLDPRFKTDYSSEESIVELEAEAEPCNQSSTYSYLASSSRRVWLRRLVH